MNTFVAEMGDNINPIDVTSPKMIGGVEDGCISAHEDSIKKGEDVYAQLSEIPPSDQRMANVLEVCARG